MIELIQTVIVAILVIVLVLGVAYSTLVWPLILLWYIKNHACRWVALSFRIRAKLRRRKNFSWFNSRRRRGNDIFWKLERRNILHVFRFMVLATIPLLLTFCLGQLLTLIRHW